MASALSLRFLSTIPFTTFRRLAADSEGLTNAFAGSMDSMFLYELEALSMNIYFRFNISSQTMEEQLSHLGSEWPLPICDSCLCSNQIKSRHILRGFPPYISSPVSCISLGYHRLGCLAIIMIVGEVGKQMWRAILASCQNTGNFNKNQLQENHFSFLLVKCLDT